MPSHTSSLPGCNYSVWRGWNSWECKSFVLYPGTSQQSLVLTHLSTFHGILKSHTKQNICSQSWTWTPLHKTNTPNKISQAYNYILNSSLRITAVPILMPLKLYPHDVIFHHRNCHFDVTNSWNTETGWKTENHSATTQHEHSKWHIHISHTYKNVLAHSQYASFELMCSTIRCQNILVINHLNFYYTLTLKNNIQYS